MEGQHDGITQMELGTRKCLARAHTKHRLLLGMAWDASACVNLENSRVLLVLHLHQILN